MLEVLDPIQHDAVTSNSLDILCDSKAGSGKTRILMNRCLYLLDNGVKPDEIMLVTFTNKAAQEMSSRICRLSPEGKNILCGTFHYIAMMYIRENATELGFTKDFTILSPEDAKKLMKGIIKTYAVLHPDVEIDRMEHIKYNVLLNAYSRARNLNLHFDDFVLDKLQFTFGEQEAAAEIIELYATAKKLNNTMDFDDLLEFFRDLLQDPVIGEKIAGRFKHILVDEYQDINQIQNAIIFYLRGNFRNLFVVGDPYQCIYGFRGSKVEYIRDFADNYSAESFCVNNNYRSIQPILDVANEITRGKTPMRSMVSGNERPTMQVCKDNFAQAKVVTKAVKDKIASGVNPSQIAILIRNTLDESLLEAELTKNGIPYVLRAGFSYFERSHIKDTLMFLATLVSHKNDMAMKRVLAMFDGFGAKTIDNVVKEIKKQDISVYAMMRQILDGRFKVSSKAKVGAETAFNVYDKVLRSARSSIIARQNDSVYTCIREFLNSFYEEYLTINFMDDFKERIADVSQLAKMANVSDKKNDIMGFVNEAMIDTSVNSKESGKDVEKIVISTIHRAKGLEWDHVIICNMENRFYEEKREDALDEFEAPEPERLAYVAVTRARKSLFITCSEKNFQAEKALNYKRTATMLACITRSKTIRMV